jgi:hypothetical protein
MIAKRFQVGDRVKARATIGQVRAGMLGTIRRAFISIPDAYHVQFDDYPIPRMIQRRELERVARAPAQSVGHTPNCLRSPRPDTA